jgi:adenine specific DNA methylase Mod
LFEDLDNALDGWLIKSENYQALNTILPKFREKVQTIYIDPPFNTGNDFDYVDRFQDSSWLSLMSNRLENAKNLLYKKGGLFLHLDWNANFLGRLLLNNIFGEEHFRNEIVWAYTGAGTTPGQFPRKHDNILWFSKSEDILFNSENLRVPYKKSSASAGKTSFTGKADEEILRKLDERGKLIEDWWPDIGTIGYAHSQILGFETQKPERLLKRIIISNSNKEDIVLDFFLGSGTTTAVAHKLKRKWIGVEMGEHFWTVVLPRMKRVLAYDKSGISKEKDVKEKYNKDKAGGFFKYYELEQYEDTLRKVKYEDSDLFENPYKDPYNQYVFMRDLKMLFALKIDYENNKVKVDLSKLYPNIDISETLSNLLGKWIKKITPDFVEFEDGEKINTKDLDYKLIKPLIWW